LIPPVVSKSHKLVLAYCILLVSLVTMPHAAAILPRFTDQGSQLLPIFVVGSYFLLAFLLLRTIYRLYFHPLRKIPGPKLAAASHLVEFYYDVILGGRFCWEVERMHQRYGTHTWRSIKTLLTGFLNRTCCSHQSPSSPR
jgi:hypothetical protein